MWNLKKNIYLYKQKQVHLDFISIIKRKTKYYDDKSKLDKLGLRQLVRSQPTKSKPQIGLDLTFFFNFTESKFYSKWQTNPNQTIWNTT